MNATSTTAMWRRSTDEPAQGDDGPRQQAAKGGLEKTRWKVGHGLQLLENGEQFYPTVFEAIGQARHEVLLETFIWFDDTVGRELHAVLIAAAKRGVQVDVLVDGYGSPDLSAEFIGALGEAGVRLRVFDPAVRVFGQRVNMLRRMHRKIVVVDGERAFVGGINYSDDHLGSFGPMAKQDYSMEVRGPIVQDIQRFARDAIGGGGKTRRGWLHRRPRAEAQPHQGQGSKVMFVTRDNHKHLNDIERHYRAAIRSARERVLIANAYFFPGYRLLREMRRAARRGVKVELILQGEPDMPIVKVAAGWLYDWLQQSGVHIHEYCKRPLHGKVAVVDDRWATVGSSNLDPLSLALNLEANLVVQDEAFARELGANLEQLITYSCKEVPKPDRQESRWALWPPLRSFVIFHFLRRLPMLASWLPRHRPLLRPAHEVVGTAPPAAPATSQGNAGPPHVSLHPLGGPGESQGRGRSHEVTRASDSH